MRLVLPPVRFLLAAALVACGSSSKPKPPPEPPTIVEGSELRIEIEGERITSIGPATTTMFVWPSIIDSHVHVVYWGGSLEELVSNGVGAVVDLASPDKTFPQTGNLTILASGPMLTRPGGYPLDSWGSDGYGIGCADDSAVISALASLQSRGARVVKIALDDHGLDPALLPQAAELAHTRGMKVAVHALSNRSALLAARAGADILAHTPVEPLAEETVIAWRNRAVISTLAAFGGSAEAIENLRRLRAAGTTILYGTDLGNTHDAGPNEEEIALLRRAGLDDAAIVGAMTTTPARFWGLSFGGFVVGKEATFLVLDKDPLTDASALLAPRHIFLRGQRVR